MHSGPNGESVINRMHRRSAPFIILSPQTSSFSALMPPSLLYPINRPSAQKKKFSTGAFSTDGRDESFAESRVQSSFLAVRTWNTTCVHFFGLLKRCPLSRLAGATQGPLGSQDERQHWRDSVET